MPPSTKGRPGEASTRASDVISGGADVDDGSGLTTRRGGPSRRRVLPAFSESASIRIGLNQGAERAYYPTSPSPRRVLQSARSHTIDQVFFVFRETTRLGQSQDRSQPPCPLRVRTSCSRRQGCRWWLGELRSGDSARITNNAQCHFPQEGHFRTRLARQDFKHLAGRCVHRPTATQAPIAQPVVITTLEVVNSIHTIYDGLPVQAEHAPRRHKPVEAQR